MIILYLFVITGAFVGISLLCIYVTIYNQYMTSHPRTHIMYLFLCIAALFGMGSKAGPELQTLISDKGKTPSSYIVEKAISHRLILLGTRHDSRLANSLISEILTGLAKQAGVNALFVEIPSSQQNAIDRFSQGDGQVQDIKIPGIIASQEYLKILATAKDLGMHIIAIDTDNSAHGSRDEWMASCISEYLDKHPGFKGLVVVGNCHVYKNVGWAHEGCQTLAEKLLSLKPFCIIMWPGALEKGAPVALDIEHQAFLGLKDPTLMCMNVLPDTCLSTTADGVILLGNDRAL